MKCLIEDWHKKTTRCGCWYERRDFYTEDTTSLMNLVTCHTCLEACIPYSQLAIIRYAELERELGEVTINPS